MMKIACKYGYSVVSGEKYISLKVSEESLSAITVSLLNLNDGRVDKVCLLDAAANKDIFVEKGEGCFILNTGDARIFLGKTDVELLFSFIVDMSEGDSYYDHVDIEADSDAGRINLCVGMIS